MTNPRGTRPDPRPTDASYDASYDSADPYARYDAYDAYDDGGPGRPAGAGPRVTPGPVFLAVALIGSVVYALYAITVRDPSQMPLLASGAVVLAIVFIAGAAYSLRATWRAGLEGRDGRAIAIGITGGIAALIGAGCVAAAFILFMLMSQPATA